MSYSLKLIPRFYCGPEGDPATSHTLSELCNQMSNGSDPGRVYTFLFYPDHEESALDISKYNTFELFEETKMSVKVLIQPQST